MTVADLLRRVRKKLDDAVGATSERFWTDQQLIDDYGNQRLYDMARIAKRLFVETAAITLTTGTHTYDLAEYITDIARIKITGVTWPLTRTTAAALDETYPSWETRPNGMPESFLVDINSRAFRIVPPPTASYLAGTMTVWRTHTTPMSYLSPTVAVPLLLQYQDALIPGICAAALIDGDEEAIRPQKAANFEAEFRDRCGDIARIVFMQTADLPDTNGCPDGLI